MIYIDIFTNRDKGITLVAQKSWLIENGITNVKHIGTNEVTKRVKLIEGDRFTYELPTEEQFNRWRFENEEDALAFKLAWTE